MDSWMDGWDEMGWDWMVLVDRQTDRQIYIK